MRFVMIVVLLALGSACAGSHDLHEESSLLSDDRANPYAFNRSLVYTLLKTQQPAEATRVIRRMIDLDDDSAEPYYLLGWAHTDMRELSLAERALREALRRKPDYADAHAMLGVLRDMQSRHAEAQASHERAIRYAPTKAAYRNNLGFHFYLRGDYAKAAHAYELALERDGGSHRTHNNLGFTYGKLGRMEDAARHFQLAGPPAQAINNMGVVHEARGELELAFEYYVASCQQDPRLLPARANLERICTRLGRAVPQLPEPDAPARTPEDPTALSMSAPRTTEASP